jgi:hypothetical protein
MKPAQAEVTLPIEAILPLSLLNSNMLKHRSGQALSLFIFSIEITKISIVLGKLVSRNKCFSTIA